MSPEKAENPVMVSVLSWFGIIFGIMYILVAVVNVVLSILDRTYANIDKNMLIGLYGLPILIVSLGFKSHYRWGWIGYVILLAAVVIWSFVGSRDGYGLAVGLLSLLALAGALLPSVRKHFFTV